MPGVAKLLDIPSHFSKLEIFHVPQLNTHLKGMQKMELFFTEMIFVEIHKQTYNICVLNVNIESLTHLFYFS